MTTASLRKKTSEQRCDGGKETSPGASTGTAFQAEETAFAECLRSVCVYCGMCCRRRMWLERGEPRGQWPGDEGPHLTPVDVGKGVKSQSLAAMAPRGQAALQEVISSVCGKEQQSLFPLIISGGSSTSLQ